jgi:hypothetical protein
MTVWEQLKDDIKAEFEKEAVKFPSLGSIEELKSTDYFTDIRYYIFQDIQFKAVVNLGYSTDDSKHFLNFLKK